MNELRRSEVLTDWFVVDGAHFGQPEGNCDEWREAIALMRAGKSGQPGRRLGVRMCPEDPDVAALYSPRNAIGAGDFSLVGAPLTEWIAAAEKVLDGPSTDSVIRLLIAVARSAHALADDAEDNGESLTIDRADFDALSKALDDLDLLPEPGPNIFGTGPAKAEAILFPE